MSELEHRASILISNLLSFTLWEQISKLFLLGGFIEKLLREMIRHKHKQRDTQFNSPVAIRSRQENYIESSFHPNEKHTSLASNVPEQLKNSLGIY